MTSLRESGCPHRQGHSRPSRLGAARCPCRLQPARAWTQLPPHEDPVSPGFQNVILKLPRIDGALLLSPSLPHVQPVLVSCLVCDAGWTENWEQSQAWAGLLVQRPQAWCSSSPHRRLPRLLPLFLPHLVSGSVKGPGQTPTRPWALSPSSWPTEASIPVFRGCGHLKWPLF